jgi:hypothetical protein
VEFFRESDHLGDPDVDSRIILKWTFRKWDEGVLTGSSWRRIGTGGGNLRVQRLNFGFHKLLGNTLLTQICLASQEGLFCMQ